MNIIVENCINYNLFSYNLILQIEKEIILIMDFVKIYDKHTAYLN